MMDEIDEWVSDPSVLRMRELFSRMEEAQRKLLEQAGISSLDARLRLVRDQARVLFEKACSHSAAQDINTGDDTVAGLYTYCLAWALGRSGVEISEKFLPDDERLKELIREILS
jgi:hypothetical protein